MPMKISIWCVEAINVEPLLIPRDTRMETVMFLLRRRCSLGELSSRSIVCWYEEKYSDNRFNRCHWEPLSGVQSPPFTTYINALSRYISASILFSRPLTRLIDSFPRVENFQKLQKAQSLNNSTYALFRIGLIFSTRNKARTIANQTHWELEWRWRQLWFLLLPHPAGALPRSNNPLPATERYGNQLVDIISCAWYLFHRCDLYPEG